MVTQMADTASVTFTPSVGAHFYYAKVTQADGNILWSAPVWVTQEETALRPSAMVGTGNRPPTGH
jgi:hypothetical protein